ncbi:MAG: hypothetical protein H6625_02430 [Bdellovibrionaceae bacterium]|nr:hypothetical protein [Pseudobdellovibrionaceae bacterium]
MQGFILFLIFIFQLSISSLADSYNRIPSSSTYSTNDFDKDRFDQMNDVIRLYNKVGTDPDYMSEFISVQNSFINRMKSEGAVDKVLLVNNSFDQAYSCSISVIKRENGRVLAILFESNFGDYAKLLKIYSVTHMKRGINLLRVSEPRSFMMKIEEGPINDQFTLVISYLEDYIQRKFNSKKFLLQSSRNRWNLFEIESGRYVRNAIFDIWYEVTNGGVRRVSFN